MSASSLKATSQLRVERTWKDIPLAQHRSGHDFNQRWKSSGEISSVIKSPTENQGGCGFVFGFCNSNQVHEVVAKFQREFVMITCPNSSEDYRISESPDWTSVGKEKGKWDTRRRCDSTLALEKLGVRLGRPDLHGRSQTQPSRTKEAMTSLKRNREFMERFTRATVDGLGVRKIGRR